MNDDRLHDAFAELRRHETAHAPRFDALWRSRLAPARRLPMASLAFAMLLLITAAFMVLRQMNKPPQAPPITAWRAPTDFLLQTPGRELIHSIPDLKGTIR
jgi:hypothetical protein